MKIIDECFPKGHTLRPVFNRSTFKISYSCMPNIKKIIDAHNKKLTSSKETVRGEKTCNCRKRDQLPLENNCLSKGIVYQATVTSEGGNETYIGITDTEIKSRFRNHKQSFEKKYANQTELSKYVWELKRKKIEYQITWKIIDKASSYSPISKRCNLCILEKYYILKHRDKATLNKRSELASSCYMHASKFLLKNIK